MQQLIVEARRVDGGEGEGDETLVELDMSQIGGLVLSGKGVEEALGVLAAGVVPSWRLCLLEAAGTSPVMLRSSNMRERVRDLMVPGVKSVRPRLKPRSLALQ